MGIADLTVAGLVFIFVIFGCLDSAQSQRVGSDSTLLSRSRWISLQREGPDRLKQMGDEIDDRPQVFFTYAACITQWNIPYDEPCIDGQEDIEDNKRKEINKNFWGDFQCGDIPLPEVKTYIQVHCFRFGPCMNNRCKWGDNQRYDQDKNCDEEFKAFRHNIRNTTYTTYAKDYNCTEVPKVVVEEIGDRTTTLITTTTSSCDQPVPYSRLRYVLLTAVFIVLVLGQSVAWTSTLPTTSQ